RKGDRAPRGQRPDQLSSDPERSLLRGQVRRGPGGVPIHAVPFAVLLSTARRRGRLGGRALSRARQRIAPRRRRRPRRRRPRGAQPRDQTRARDRPATGGDEFLVLMPQSTLEEARIAAERVREAVDAQGRADPRIAITVSAGVASWRAGRSAEQVLEAADLMLYAAKRAGKDRVMAEVSLAPAGGDAGAA